MNGNLAISYPPFEATRIETLFCTKCNLNFTSKAEFDKHIQDHIYETDAGKVSHMRYIESFVCSECDKTFEIKSDLMIHYSTVCLQAPFICKHCKQNCAHITNLRAHLMHIHHYTPELLASEGYTRDIIHDHEMGNYSFESILGNWALNYGLSEELSELHNIDDTTYTSMRNTKSKNSDKLAFNLLDKTHICAICSESFSRKCVLDIHVQKHFLFHKKELPIYKPLHLHQNNRISDGNIENKDEKYKRNKGFKTVVPPRRSGKIQNTEILEITEKYSGVEKSVTSNDVDSTSWKMFKLKRKIKRITFTDPNVAGPSRIETQSNEVQLKHLKSISSKRKTGHVRNTNIFEVISSQSSVPSNSNDIDAWKKMKLKRKIQNISTISDDTGVSGTTKILNKSYEMKNVEASTSKVESGKINNTNSSDVIGPKAVSDLSTEKTTSLRKKVQVTRKNNLKRKIKNASRFDDQSEAGPSIKGLSKNLRKKIASKRKPLRRNVKKGFICEVCNKKFKDGYKLRRHFLIHSGKRPYTCEKCKKAFARDDHLKRHIQKVCNKIKKSE